MDAETAKQLADAMNRLASALESLRGGSLGGGINIYHHGLGPVPHLQPAQWPWYPMTLCGPIAYSGGVQ
jgi:hypothetical protein